MSTAAIIGIAVVCFIAGGSLGFLIAAVMAQARVR